MFSSDILNTLKTLGGTENVSDLAQSEAFGKIIQTLHGKMGHDEFETAVGSQLAVAKLALDSADEHQFVVRWRESPPATKPDELDMKRGWGWQLLPRDDVAFRDPQYLARALRRSDARAEGMETNRQANGLMDSEPRRLFEKAWSAIAPQNVHSPTVFTLTGTDANNLLYDLADQATHVEKGKAEILVFDGAYGGGSGRISRVGRRPNRDPSGKDFLITSPTSPTLNPHNRDEVARLKPLEDQALREIEEKFRSGTAPIGGLLLEPIQGANGVRFYRTEFLLRVRSLCDELKIPIFADEILTGGGRTGKFFAYEHYEGFEPDFVTFGKGLQAAGIAGVSRANASVHYNPLRRITTLSQNNEVLLKSAQIMTRIKDGNLMARISESGAYLIHRLKNLALERLRASVLDQEQRIARHAEDVEMEIQRIQSDIDRRTRWFQEVNGSPDARRRMGYEIESSKKWLERLPEQKASDLVNQKRHLAELRQRLARMESSAEGRNELARGIGGLIYAPDSKYPKSTVERTDDGRLLPPLTLTHEQVDKVMMHESAP
jgi:acetylornithine/succinyldiaminopimelate/putrescine aminotransferase